MKGLHFFRKKRLTIAACVSAILLGTSLPVGIIPSGTVYAEEIQEQEENQQEENILNQSQNEEDVVPEALQEGNAEPEEAVNQEGNAEPEEVVNQEGNSAPEELINQDGNSESNESSNQATASEPVDEVNTDGNTETTESEVGETETLAEDNNDITNPGADEVAPAGVADSSGTAETTKPVLTLRSMSHAKVYDGKPLTNGSEPLEIETGWKEGDGANYNFTESQTDTGVTLNKFEIIPWDGTNLDDYILNVSYGDLTVMERLEDQKYILTITGMSGEAKYTGQEQTLSGFTLSARSNSQQQVEGKGVPEEKIAFTVGDINYFVTGITATATGKNAGSYVVNISGSPQVFDAGDHNVTNEFRFEYYAGTFVISPRNVVLTSGSSQKRYDGKNLKNHEVTVSGEGFAPGEGASYSFSGKQKEVGESYNYFEYTMNVGCVESNYEITKVPGKLKVKKAKNSNDSESSSQKENQSGGSASDNSSSESNSSSGDSQQNSQGNETQNPQTTAGDGSEGDAVATNNSAADTKVLGAHRNIQSEQPDAASGEKTSEESVLGARRAGTDDMTQSIEIRVQIMLLAAIMAAGLVLGDKRKKYE